jgi:hypothetical protein
MTPQPASKPLSRGKRLAFKLLAVLFALGLMELASLGAILWSYGYLAEQRHFVAEQDPLAPKTLSEHSMMIHPYIGMVYRPPQTSPHGADQQSYGISEYGFHDTASPIHQRAPGRVIIGVMGGSVARQLVEDSQELLARELAQHPQFQGRTFEFVHLALDGGKQPQQLMILNYLLTLGAEFDIIINLDGVNESALPGMDNVPFGVSAAFPRKWNILLAGVGSRHMMLAVGHLMVLKRQKHDCAIWYDSFPLRYSPTGLLLWSIRNNRYDRLLIERQEAISRLSEQEGRFDTSGPQETFESEQQLLEHCVEIWARSSIQLHHLCRANGIRYFHFLQPNQYLVGSKPMGAAELNKATNKASPFARPVRIAFPLMQAQASRLTAAGVEFTDLTLVFVDHPEPIYKDDCCHVTPRGDEIMAVAIAAKIKASWDSRSEPAP